jgi:pimeloyl-ACP methyl ester carboxylesterase
VKAVSISVLLLAALMSPTQASANTNTRSCSRETASVKLSDTAEQTYNVVGWLCGNARSDAVQLLVSGLTYDHTYWDQSPAYSYVRFANAVGATTFNIDRIGVGESDKPPAAEVTVPSEAFVVKQIAHRLKDHYGFKKVIGVGHSLGAAILMIEGSYSDAGVDGLILADYTHVGNVPFIVEISSLRHPAADDPKFAGAGLPEGYVTSLPGTRGHQFFNEDFVDPRVVAADETLKATGTTGELLTINVARNPVYSSAIRVPVLIVVGQKDRLDCDEAVVGLSCQSSKAIEDREESLFPNARSFEAFTLRSSGHSTNLHFDAVVWYLKANLWSRGV